EYSHQIMSTFIKQNLNHSYLKLTLEKTPRVVCIYEGNQRMASFHHNELKPVPYYEDERGLNLLGLSNALVVDSNLFSDSLIAKARQLNKKIIAYASLSLEKELKGAKKLFDQANIIWISLPNETLTPEDVINTYVFQYHQLLVISTVTDFYIFMGSTCYMTQPSESEKARDGVCDYEYFAKFIQLTISGDRPLLALYKTTNRLVDVHYPLGHTTAY
ncbi:MAG TPA: hypothetical protein DCY20_04330, partial [Firmicutes bacterium]|nr:hypothetical protein [Bacillota bacterium]